MVRSRQDIRVGMVSVAAATILCLGFGIANAAECSVQARSDTVVLVLCPPGLDREAWRKAGEGACGAAVRCNAWIWDDRENVPDTAPSTDAELQENDVRNAVAIWVNDAQTLVKVREVPGTPR